MFIGSLSKATISKNIVSLDVTPNSVNWTDTYGSFEATTNSQTISGIDQDITLKTDFLLSEGGGSRFNYVIIDGGSPIGISDNSTFTVSNGNTVAFKIELDSGSSAGETIEVINVTDNNTSLDTFFIQATNPNLN